MVKQKSGTVQKWYIAPLQIEKRQVTPERIRLCWKDIYYFSSPGGYEVDFYLPQKQQLIQVTQNLNHPAVRDREFRALQDAMQIVKVQNALILADSNADTIEINGTPVEIHSAAEWLLNE